MVITGDIRVRNFKCLFEHLNRILIFFLLHIGESFTMPELRIVLTDFNSSIEIFLGLLILTHSEKSVPTIEEEVRIWGFNLFLVQLNGLIEVIQSIVIRSVWKYTRPRLL